MELKEWEQKIKGLKKSLTHTGCFGVKITRARDTGGYFIYKDEMCKSCKRRDKGGLLAHFNSNEKGLTIFEADMLYCVYVLGKLPFDYAQYHKCQAGNEFIENIKKIENIQYEQDYQGHKELTKSFSGTATLEEIKKNDYNLSAKRYLKIEG